MTKKNEQPKRNFDIGYKVTSYEEYLKIKESLLKPQPIPEPLQKAVEYATRKILYDGKDSNQERIVIAEIVYPSKKAKFSRLKSFLKRNKKNQNINL